LQTGNSGFKVCSNIHGGVTYGKCCKRYAAVELVGGCDTVAITAMIYHKQRIVVSFEVKNKWRYTSIHSYAFMAWKEITLPFLKDRKGCFKIHA
jgi:hypothetical protein